MRICWRNVNRLYIFLESGGKFKKSGGKQKSGGYLKKIIQKISMKIFDQKKP